MLDVVNLTEIVDRVHGGDDVSPYRPDLTLAKCEESVSRCIQDCWQDDPEMRPDFKYCRILLKSMQKGLYVYCYSFVALMPCIEGLTAISLFITSA